MTESDNFPNHSRRSFTAGLVTASAMAVVGGAIKGADNLLNQPQKSVPSEDKLSKLYTPQKKDSIERSFPTQNTGLVGYFSEKDKAFIDPLVKKQIQEFTPFFTTHAEHAINVRRWEAQIDNALSSIDHSTEFDLSEHGINIHDLIKGIMLVESKGDPQAEGATGEIGLMQLMPDTAAKIYADMQKSGEAEKAGLKEFSLRDPRTNIILGIKHLQDMMRIFHDPTVALLAYNSGSKNVERYVKEYALEQINKEKDINKKTDAQREFNIMLEDMNTPGTAQLAKKYNITVASLLDSPAVNKKLNELNPKEKELVVSYVPKVAATTRLLTGA